MSGNSSNVLLSVFLYSLIGLLQIILLVFLAPLINTIMKKMKAFLQNRQGPVLLQGYYDLRKWFVKETIIPETATILFTISPPLVFATIITASLLLPTFFPISFLQPMGGVLLFIGLLGLARFFMAAAALDSPGGFCGMGSNREMMLGALIEPVMLLSLFVFVMFCGTSNINGMVNGLNGTLNINPAMMVALLSFYVSVVAEMGRVPFDNPETHYELTMIHEAMMLEYSGRFLALLHWAAWTKQLLLLSLLAALIPPYNMPSGLDFAQIGTAALFYGLKIFLLCALTAMVETTIAKVRIFRNKDLMSGAFVLALLALVLAAQDLSGVLS